jgi:hypothetical protein
MLTAREETGKTIRHVKYKTMTTKNSYTERINGGPN